MVVKASLVEQFLGRASFDDFTTLYNEKLIGVTDGAQPVGDNEAGAPFH
jgi:hypothetical protein